MVRSLLWTSWVLGLLAGVSFHYGPGRALLHEQRAATLFAQAETARQAAEQLHERATARHEIRVVAKRRADASGTPEDIERAERAFAEEQIAWQDARDAWKIVAEALDDVQAELPQASDRARSVRLRHARALLGSGHVFAAADNLEKLLNNVGSTGGDSVSIARQIRAELASAYYMGAREMRMQGQPDDQWRQVSALSRQHFRHLSEQAATTPAQAAARATYQQNLEVVLNLEQHSLDEIEATPTPYPPAGCDCDFGLSRRPAGQRENQKRKRSDNGRIADPNLNGGW